MSSSKKVNFDTLATLARGATAGEREFYSDGEIIVRRPDTDPLTLLPEPAAIIAEVGRYYPDGEMVDKREMTANHRLFAALDPDTVLALINQAERCQKAEAIAEKLSHWSDEDLLEFLSVAMRHVEIKGNLHLQDLRDAFDLRAQRLNATASEAKP